MEDQLFKTNQPHLDLKGLSPAEQKVHPSNQVANMGGFTGILVAQAPESQSRPEDDRQIDSSGKKLARRQSS
jgi:hypothetical protein